MTARRRRTNSGGDKAARDNQQHDQTNVQATERLTNKYVRKINDGERRIGRTKFAQGKNIDEFFLEYRRLNPGATTDLYRILAEHPDCVVGARQLRHYHQVYILTEELGGEDVFPNLTGSHLVQVLPASLNIDAKRDLLAAAEKENLSVADFKKRIRQERTHEPETETTAPDPTTDSEPDWDAELGNLAGLAERTLNQLHLIHNVRRSQSIPDELREQLTVLATFLIFNDLVNTDAITDRLRGDDEELTT